MSEANEMMVVTNPYAVAPAQGVSLSEQPRHDSGNALAATGEARAIAEVKAQVLMARQFPRDPALSANRILIECQRNTLADAAVYAFARGKETVSGASIRLAEVIARNWGNCTFGMQVLERSVDKDGIGKSAIRTFAWDFETNTYVSREFEVKHWRTTRSGGYALKEDRDIYELEANMAARRIRACILQIIPGDVTQMAVDACRMTASSGLAEKMKDKNARETLIAQTVRVYEKMGVTLDDLEGYLNARKDDWSADHMLRLKELKNSLDDGAVSMGDAFPRLAGLGKNDVISKEQVAALMEAAKKSGKQQTISDMLKKAGIAKFADIPAGQYEKVMKMITGLTAASAALPDPMEDNPPITEGQPPEA